MTGSYAFWHFYPMNTTGQRPGAQLQKTLKNLTIAIGCLPNWEEDPMSHGVDVLDFFSGGSPLVSTFGIKFYTWYSGKKLLND